MVIATKMLPYDNETKGHNLVMEASELLQVREKICSLYFKQKVIVAPCLAKLYLSRELKDTHDDDSSTSPNWLYFATGLISIIYDEERNEVKLTLFGKDPVRLLWCLKWADFVNCQMPTSRFHVINTEAGDHRHVGILYANKDVAELIAHTVMLYNDSIKMSNFCKKYYDNQSTNHKYTDYKNIEIRENYNFEKRRSSLRDSLTRTMGKELEKYRSKTIIGNGEEFSGIVAKRAIRTTERPKSENTESRLTRLSRADSFRKHKSQTIDDPAIECTTDEKKIEKHHKTSGESNKDSMFRSLFKIRRISRTQSLKVEDEHANSNRRSDLRKVNSHLSDYEHAEKQVKPRAQTDSSLLPGDNIRFLIDTGLSAQSVRKHKYLAKDLSTEDIPATDSCTENMPATDSCTENMPATDLCTTDV